MDTRKFKMNISLIDENTGMIKRSQPLVINYTKEQEKKYGSDIEEKIFDMFIETIMNLFGENSSFLLRKKG